MCITLPIPCTCVHCTPPENIIHSTCSMYIVHWTPHENIVHSNCSMYSVLLLTILYTLPVPCTPPWQAWLRRRTSVCWPAPGPRSESGKLPSDNTKTIDQSNCRKSQLFIFSIVQICKICELDYWRYDISSPIYEIYELYLWNYEISHIIYDIYELN